MITLVVVGALAATAAAEPKKLGVGFVPHMDAGDKAEVMLHRFVGEMPEVDQIFNINGGEHMLKTLVKLKKKGKKLDYLVLAGHGSRETPAMKWAKDDMLPQEINLAFQKEQLAIARRSKGIKGLSKARMKEIDDTLRTAPATIKLLEAIPGVMKSGAVVVMINCSAAGTDEGKAFVETFGKLLLGADGGQIVASTTDISLREVEDIYDQVGELFGTGEVKAWGEPYITGSWVTVHIPKGSTNKLADVPAKPAAPPSTPEPGKELGVFVAGDVVMVNTRTKVEEYPTCNISGWGVDCNRSFADAVVDGGLKEIRMLEGPFPDLASACKKYRELAKDGTFQREKIRTDYAGC